MPVLRTFGDFFIDMYYLLLSDIKDVITID